uniref:Uncharacterized protein n=1 Tax=Aegilops tauschii TaxID=37682 RepID=M8AZU4_AEGTA
MVLLGVGGAEGSTLLFWPGSGVPHGPALFIWFLLSTKVKDMALMIPSWPDVLQISKLLRLDGAELVNSAMS